VVGISGGFACKTHQIKIIDDNTPPHELLALWKTIAKHPRTTRTLPTINKLIAIGERKIEEDRIRLAGIGVRWD
jgi:hypothetical protein